MLLCFEEVQSGMEKKKQTSEAKISEFQVLVLPLIDFVGIKHTLLALSFLQNMVICLPDPVIVSNKLLLTSSLSSW